VIDDPFDWTTLLGETQACLESAFMHEMSGRRREAGVQGSMGSFDAAVLFALTKACRPRIALETGSYTGMSSTFILHAMHEARILDAELHTIDRRNDATIVSLVPDRLRRGLVCHHGEVRELLDAGRLPAEIDLFLHDSTHRYAYQRWELDAFWPRIRRGGLLVSHDVDMNGSFADFIGQTYVHDEGGQTDWTRTAHALWGRLGGLGFAIKR
jgi:predicted O-methyltransferase YrrM